MKSVTRGFVLPRFGSCKPTPVEEATKVGSLSTLPSLKRSLGPSELLFSNHLGIKLPARTTTRLVFLASITSECLITRKNAKEKKRSKRKSSNEHYKSLSLVENWVAMNGGVVGVFIAPTTKLAVW
jgi:hypothetical protein